jgi:transposase
VNHAAIDLGSKESQVCIRRSDGTILQQFKHPTRSLAGLLKRWERSRVILETSAEAFAVADQALAAGHEVRVVPSTLVRSLGVGDHGVKTDQRDARALSEASCRVELRSVHIPSQVSRDLKSMSGTREALVEVRTKLINNARGWLRTNLWGLGRVSTASFPPRVRAKALADGRSLPTHLEQSLLVLDELNRQLRAMDRELKNLAKAHPVCRRLMTIPGVGPVTAVRFVAAIDDEKRFHSAHGVSSYLGLTPGLRQSSQQKHTKGITKAGPRAVRRTLVQAAWVALRTQPDDPMVQWAMKIAARRGKYVAVVALARKMAGVMFALWRDATTYEATRGARSPQP